ncbi:uncharacterized protein SPAPADRAFT_158781 [Spathaspora passalidarum NRRL Y-27907]|uniref:Sister chromatid cohesion protein DCC1 n=1 Tax=Spathaspora passalidarum (strain NRRL Y-27907 / 11-Y1) TaxID=619300 RepID=G3AVN8_SPAPN|nr:uncharacterized protein SPAPADRAFT_158781 [Spathaspora passalidarum NRRL Y-27907]EGW30202.1 hypothetical protein SPAPADRAFT_158781 [Spathaspora passalidarum NRRL Y-27907]
MYQLYQQINKDDKHTYKLLQLPPDLLTHLSTSSDSELLIKSDADASSVVICNNDTTWKLRQMNHSNTVVLLDNLNIKHRDTSLSETTNVLIGGDMCSYEYELTSTKGVINVDKIPVYDGDELQESITLDELSYDSLCSKNEFVNNWYELGGCEIMGKAYLLSPRLITEILYVIITYLISRKINYNNSFNLQDIKVVDENINESMVFSVLHKFGQVADNEVTLQNDKIAKWFGVIELAKSDDLINANDFLINWKGSLPPFYNVSLDIADLRGYYSSPILNKMRYVNPKLLSTNLSTRFSQLFEIDNNWDYDLFVPLIEEFVPKGKKIDTLIIKYARKKKITKNKFTVCPR